MKLTLKQKIDRPETTLTSGTVRPLLDDIVENVLDIAREQPIDEARIIIRDLLYKAGTRN